MIKAGIIGGAGYAAGELIRLLLIHPDVELDFVQSGSCKGKHLAEVHGDLIGETDMKFSSGNMDDTDVIFLCMGHGKSRAFLEKNVIQPGVKIIDLSEDFRTDSGFSYGLPELNKENYTSRIANPGCFATAIQLAILPLAINRSLEEEVHVHAITGSTGAGQHLSATSHFSWRHGNVSVYKPFCHQHLIEIQATLKGVNSGAKVQFIPVRGPFTRGIFATLYAECSLELDKIKGLYRDFYRSAQFTTMAKNTIDLKQVVNTNKCLIHLEKHRDKVLITSAIDNLLKGASGQAVQNMNIVFGLPESKGLQLKGSLF